MQIHKHFPKAITVPLQSSTSTGSTTFKKDSRLSGISCLFPEGVRLSIRVILIDNMLTPSVLGKNRGKYHMSWRIDVDFRQSHWAQTNSVCSNAESIPRNNYLSSAASKVTTRTIFSIVRDCPNMKQSINLVLFSDS